MLAALRMQSTVRVQPLRAIWATNSPKPLSSAAVHSVFVIRHGAVCATAADETAMEPANVRDTVNASDVRTQLLHAEWARCNQTGRFPPPGAAEKYRQNHKRSLSRAALTAPGCTVNRRPR